MIKIRIRLLLLFALAFIGCKDDGKIENADDVFTAKLQSASLTEKDDLPEWLSLKIKDIEKSWEKDKIILKVRIYQGEWKNRTIYFIKNNLSSCYFCEVYYEEGEQEVFKEKDANDFCIKSANWKLIYEYGDAIIF
ncbi:MAG: hypothetical protein LBT83_07885 [Tannerella sp.]|jgi:hypothetical protein|nr:hypothetical protein [Tannerella sp.]